MVAITRRGVPCNTSGELPKVGSKAPNFRLVNKDLKNWTLKNFAGKQNILYIVPSLDPPTCARSTREFDARIAKVDGIVLIISADLPFALSRFCGAEGIDNVETASVYRAPEFGRDYGVYMADGRLGGLLARAIVVIDEGGKVIHAELVPEIAQEPDYEAVAAAL